MSTENTVFESMSEAEAAYFSGKGEVAYQPDAEPQPQADAPVDGDQKPAEAPAEGDGEDGEIFIDANGKPRSTVTGKFVPHGAFHKERERRKSLESELGQTRERMARADERLAVLNEIIAGGDGQGAAQRQPEETPPPDPEQDIFGYVKWLSERNARLEQQQAALAQQREQERVATEIQSFYRNDAVSFLQKQPDFADAYRHVASSYASELVAQGYTEAQVQQILMNEEARIAYQARQAGQSPSEIIYRMAQARGYVPKGSQPAAAKTSEASDAAAKLAAIQKGQRATQTLSGAGGQSGDGLTLEALANMSDEEFAAMETKLGKAKFRQYLGG